MYTCLKNELKWIDWLVNSNSKYFKNYIKLDVTGEKKVYWIGTVIKTKSWSPSYPLKSCCDRISPSTLKRRRALHTFGLIHVKCICIYHIWDSLGALGEHVVSTINTTLNIEKNNSYGKLLPHKLYVGFVPFVLIFLHFINLNTHKTLHSRYKYILGQSISTIAYLENALLQSNKTITR